MSPPGAQKADANKTSICFGYAPRAYTTNSRSSFTPLSKGDHRVAACHSSAVSQVRLGAEPKTDYSADSIASPHHRPFVAASAMLTAQQGQGDSGALAAKKSREALQQSHLPWQEKPDFTTTSNATPSVFLTKRTDGGSTHAGHMPQKGQAIVLGDERTKYTSSSNAASAFTEARQEFGARAFFNRGSNRQRDQDTSSGTPLAGSHSAGSLVTRAKEPPRGVVLGYDSTSYVCTNSMSRYFDRTNVPPAEKPCKQDPRSNKNMKCNIWFG